jgi:pyruvate/2-oxoglutarate dehydrogenase complex dihydrolipoamide acyltransferase (E2) component
MSNGKDMIQDWDVILESKVWDLRVGQRNVIPAWVGASNHELSLNERAGWINMRSGHPPTTTEMLRLFTSLSGVFIRGGYYDGHEESWIDNVVLKEGDHKADALLRQVEKHARHPSERVVEAEPPAAEQASTPKYSGVLRSKAAIAAHLAREAAFQAAKQAHEEEQARIAEEERQALLKQEAEAAARLAAQQEAGASLPSAAAGVEQALSTCHCLDFLPLPFVFSQTCCGRESFEQEGQ